MKFSTVFAIAAATVASAQTDAVVVTRCSTQPAAQGATTAPPPDCPYNTQDKQPQTTAPADNDQPEQPQQPAPANAPAPSDSRSDSEDCHECEQQQEGPQGSQPADSPARSAPADSPVDSPAPSQPVGSPAPQNLPFPTGNGTSNGTSPTQSATAPAPAHSDEEPDALKGGAAVAGSSLAAMVVAGVALLF